MQQHLPTNTNHVVEHVTWAGLQVLVGSTTALQCWSGSNKHLQPMSRAPPPDWSPHPAQPSIVVTPLLGAGLQSHITTHPCLLIQSSIRQAAPLPFTYSDQQTPTTDTGASKGHHCHQEERISPLTHSLSLAHHSFQWIQVHVLIKNGIIADCYKAEKWKVILHFFCNTRPRTASTTSSTERSSSSTTLPSTMLWLSSAGSTREPSCPNWICRQPSPWFQSWPPSGSSWECTGTTTTMLTPASLSAYWPQAF